MGIYMTECKRISVPVIDGQYRNIYSPAEDIYHGESGVFEKGKSYKKWATNDFSVIQDKNGIWHALGITHPCPPGFVDGFRYEETTIHEAENQLFHITMGKSLQALLNGEKAAEHEKVMYPYQRNDGYDACWAPCVVACGEGYKMFYTPEKMRYAESEDLFSWKYIGIAFDGNRSIRDPIVYREKDTYYIIYNLNESLLIRSSTDLTNWSEPKPFWTNCFKTLVCPESPFLFKREGVYYLMWCAYDGQNGCYDNRTFVFASETLGGFDGKLPITMIKGHAPEIVCENGDYYIFSVFYPENGLNVAKIKWETLM